MFEADLLINDASIPLILDWLDEGIAAEGSETRSGGEYPQITVTQAANRLWSTPPSLKYSVIVKAYTSFQLKDK